MSEQEKGGKLLMDLAERSKEHISDIEKTTPIGDEKYFFSVILSNPDGDLAQLKYSGITELVIEEDINDWYLKGYLVFKNSSTPFFKCNLKYFQKNEKAQC